MLNNIRINYKDYPECMFAMLSAFVSEEEGHDLRRVAGSAVFRSTDTDGFTYKNGLLHSFEDLPAVNVDDGKYKEWFKNGKLHREGDLPALIHGLRSEWFKDGVLHREGGPAIHEDTTQQWMICGKLHRLDGPAFINRNLQEWWVNGVLIRRQRL
jgi:hypothetical protein